MNNFNKSKNKLLSLLFSFDRYELNKLQKFIESPYFNKSEKLISLYILLKQDVIKNKVKKKEYYFTKIHANEKFDDQKFRNLISDILNLVIRFLTQEEFEEDHQAKAIYLINASKKNKLKDFYDKAINVANKYMSKNKLRNSEYFLSNYKLENNIFKLTNEFDKKAGISKSRQEIDILKINDHLDYFYMIEKLRYYNSYLSWKTMTKIEYEFPYIDKVLAIVKTYRKILPPALQIYYNIYKISIDNSDTRSYFDLKSLIEQHINIFDTYEQNLVYSFLVNFAIKQVNKGSSEFNKEFIQVYISGIESKAILDDGYLSPTSFRNIVSVALRLKRFSWTKDFINEKIVLIQENRRDNAYKYNMARYYFYTKDYKKLIETIREVEFDDNLYALISKSMLLVAYYEQFEEEALINFSETFNAYIRRTAGLSDDRRLIFKKLVKFIKILHKGRYQPSLLPTLKLDIINTPSLPSRQWFLEKLEHIKLPNE
jgi:hypothetical protein